MSELLTREQAQDFIGLGRNAFYHARNNLGLPAPVKLGGKYRRWRKSDLQNWLANLPVVEDDQ